MRFTHRALGWLALFLILSIAKAPLLAALPPEGLESLSPDVKVRRLTDHVWMHVSTMKTKAWGEVSSNGLVVVTPKGSILIDTAWNDEQTQRILQWAEGRLRTPVRKALVTHAHEDRLGGIRALVAARIPVASLDLTARKAIQQGFPSPHPTFRSTTTIRLGGAKIEAFFPGPGHTADNIVAWLPSEGILFGGCLIKELQAQGPGNTADADLAAWPLSAKHVLERYPSARIVIPGHGAIGDLSLVRHTLDLLQASR